MKKNRIYLAYGSNMNLPQMSVRCPDAEVLGTAELEGYELLFRGCAGAAVATVEPCEKHSVPVVLWSITPSCEASLDIYEGFPRLYRKETISVEIGGKTVEAMMYVMNDGRPVNPPNERYFRTIRDGYKSAGLPLVVLRDAALNSVKSSRMRRSTRV